MQRPPNRVHEDKLIEMEASVGHLHARGDVQPTPLSRDCREGEARALILRLQGELAQRDGDVAKLHGEIDILRLRLNDQSRKPEEKPQQPPPPKPVCCAMM
mmetsp:Transcript_143278/g.458099  ORF Transcript_143278/g.458099 Transcript_143278/m.458099 type:complete len:101 (-) Transcript_143278:184-486(-)